VRGLRTSGGLCLSIPQHGSCGCLYQFPNTPKITLNTRWCPNLPYLLPIQMRRGGFGSAPLSFETIAAPPATSLSNSQFPTPPSTVCWRMAMNASAACLNSGGASALTPTNTPRADGPPSGRLKLRSTPALLMQSIILPLNWVISIVSPKTATSTVFPLSREKAATRFCSWAGKRMRSANRASSCNRASLSCSAIRFASAALSFAWAISRRKRSALALASAACCSAWARLAAAFVARSFAVAAPSFALAAFSLAAAASDLACSILPAASVSIRFDSVAAPNRTDSRAKALSRS